MRRMADWDLLLTDVNIATMRPGQDPYGVVEKAALAVSDGRIAWLGKSRDMPQSEARETCSLAGCWLTPALIDCHTHLVFAGNRAAEFEQRLEGASYEEIARAGGGIMSTVDATRAAGTEQLAAESRLRLEALRREGVATIEIKSGYGLNVETEAHRLGVAESLRAAAGISVQKTFLGAHAIPSEFRGRSDDYTDLVCEEMLPRVAAASLADAVDAYCESIAFSPHQVARVFEKAAALGLPVKLHADQLSDCGGAELAASFNALSADHLEYSNEAGIQAMAAAGTVAVLLPGAFVTLGEKQLPPVAALRAHGVPVAVASDCNPGTSPICSLRAAMHLAASVFRLTPAECLGGVTREAARALGLLHDRGTLETGKRADIAAWDIGHPRELSYWLGLHQPTRLLVNGSPLAL
jgi:imidazolonepropionase